MIIQGTISSVANPQEEMLIFHLMQIQKWDLSQDSKFQEAKPKIKQDTSILTNKLIM